MYKELGFAACGGEPGAGEQPKRAAARERLPVTISFADASNGVMTTERGGLLATRDGGHTWPMLLFTDDGNEVVTAQRLGRRELLRCS